MMDLRFQKTDKGREEIATRKYHLPLRTRSALLLIDGNHTGQDLARKFPGIPVSEQMLAELLEHGFIEPAKILEETAPPAQAAVSEAPLEDTPPSEPSAEKASETEPGPPIEASDDDEVASGSNEATPSPDADEPSIKADHEGGEPEVPPVYHGGHGPSSPSPNAAGNDALPAPPPESQNTHPIDLDLLVAPDPLLLQNFENVLAPRQETCADTLAQQLTSQEARTPFQVILYCYREGIAETMGAAGEALCRMVARARTLEDLRALRKPYLEAITKVRDIDSVRRLRDELDQLLYLDGSPPPDQHAQGLEQ